MARKRNINNANNKTRTIAFRVTEKEYLAYTSNKELKDLIQKYTRACLNGVYMKNNKEY